MDDNQIRNRIEKTLAWIETELEFGNPERKAVLKDDLHLVAQGRALLKSGTKHGTMRQWMLDHDRTSVDTLQISLGSNRLEAPYNAWAPLDRTVNAHERATGVLFDESLRDYAKCRVLLASADALLIDAVTHAVLYVASSGVHCQHLNAVTDDKDSDGSTIYRCVDCKETWNGGAE